MEEIKDPWPNVEFVKNMSTLNVTSVTFKQQKRKKTSELKKKYESDQNILENKHSRIGERFGVFRSTAFPVC